MSETKWLRLLLIAVLIAPGGAQYSSSDRGALRDDFADARFAAYERVLRNALRFRKQHPILDTYRIFQRGDPFQTPDCTLGDGWAIVDFLDERTQHTVRVQCPTLTRGDCMTDVEFRRSEFRNEEGLCRNHWFF